jgi:hypothetical protein
VYPLAGPYGLQGPAVEKTCRKLQQIATLPYVGRPGTNPSPSALAYGEVKASEAIGVVPAAFPSTSTNIGWIVGVGVEGALGGNWTAKLEYLYVDLGKVSGNYLTSLAAFGFLNGS